MPDAENPTRPRRRWRWLFALGVGLLVGGLAAGLVAERRGVARFLIEAQLHALGIEEVAHEVERVGLYEFAARNLRIGANRDLFVASIDARYSLTSLLSGRLESLSVRDVQLSGRIDESGISFGSLDPFLARLGASTDGNASAPAAPVALPAADISLADIVVTLATPQGPVEARLGAELHATAGGGLRAHADGVAEHADAEASARLDAEGTETAFTGSADLGFRGGGSFGEGAQLAPTQLSVAAQFGYADDRLALHVDPAGFDFAVATGGETLRLAGESPALNLQAPGSGASALAFESSGGRVRLPDLQIELSDLSLAGDLQPGAALPAGTLRIGAVRDLHEPARLPELDVAGSFGVDGGRPTFDITASDARRRLVVTLAGSHDPATGAGSAHVSLKPLVFAPDGLQPTAVLPFLGGSIAQASGRVEALGDLAWATGAPLRAAFDVALRDLSVKAAQGSVDRLNSAIHFDGPWPLSTPPKQLVSMARIAFGLELANGLVEFRLRPDGVLAIEAAQWSLAGGTVRSQGQLDPNAATQELVLTVSDLDLGQLLQLVDVAGLTGSGTVHGHIPVVRRGPTVEVRGGVLTCSDAGGWIRYRPHPGAAATPGQGMGVVLAALANFQFEKLEATLDGDTAGPVTVAIHLAGANPDYLGGHPLEFNLNVESALMDLLRDATAVYQIPAEIEKRLEAVSRRSR